MKTKFWLSFLTSISLVSTTQTSRAQTYQPSNRIPVADSSLGTQVSGNGNNFNITGGVNKGQTLFHSFTDFSVPTNGAANFLNPANNRDIITRVTGTAFSDINGLLNTNGANFFLINPNGIVFGTNARLNVGKAFVGSTANGIDLVDAGGRMITFGTNPNGDAPLLSVAPNVLFNAARLNFSGSTGSITNFGTLQTPNNSQYIGLIGGNVTLNGSTGGGKIVAPGGRIDIGGLSGAGSVTVDNNGLVFGSVGVGRSNVVLTDGAGITVRATGTLDTVNTFFNNAASNGSSLNINANNLTLLNAGAISATLPAAIDAGLETNSGVQTKPAGNINIDATGKVTVTNSAIKNTLRAGAEGSIGDINLQAGSLDVNDSSFISTITTGKGNAGNVTVTAKDAVLLSGDSSIDSSVLAGGVGNGGAVEINSGSLSINSGANLSASTSGIGNAGNVSVTTKEAVSLVNGQIFSTLETGAIGTGGNITIDASDIALRDGAKITASTYGTGNAGNVNVRAKDAVSLANNVLIVSTVGTTGVGKGGTIDINSGSLSLIDDAVIGTSTLILGQGNAGNVNIKTTGDIIIAGNKNVSGISSSSYGQGDAGKITIDSQSKISLANSSAIFAAISPGGTGNGQDISITAKKLSLSNNSYISSNNFGDRGNAGNIDVKVSGAVDIAGFKGTSSSGILSNVYGTGNGGNISINATSLALTDSGKLSTTTYGIGNAGNIDIKSTGNLTISGTNDPALLQGDTTKSISSIESITQGKGDAGKITINTQGDLSLVNRGGIFNYVDNKGEGISQGIRIDAKDVNLTNFSKIQSSNYGGKGNAGNIDITATGNINITGTNDAALLQGDATKSLSEIASITQGKGDAGKVTITTQGNLSLVNRGGIFNYIDDTGEGTSQGIRIDAKDVNLTNISKIQSGNYGGKGNPGNIDITATGNLSITGTNDSALLQGAKTTALSEISSITQGKGDAGKITINTQGNLSIANRAGIFNTISETGIGNSKGISIAAKDLSLTKVGTIQSSNDGGTGTAGDIYIKSTGNINISGSDFQSALFQSNLDYLGLSGIFSGTSGRGDTGKITIDTTGDLNINNRGGIFSQIATPTNPAGDGNSQGIEIKNARNLALTNFSSIQSSNFGGKGNAGKIKIDILGKLSLSDQVTILSTIDTNAIGNSEGIKISAGEVELANNSKINASTYGVGNAGNIEIVTAGKYTADNRSTILAVTASDGNAGNINLNAKSVTLSTGSEILPQSTAGKGKAGNLTVITPRDGFITISGTAPSGILLDGSPGGFSSGLLATAEKDSASVAGKISLSTGTLTIENGGVISTRTRTNTAPIQLNNPQSSIVDGKYPAEPGAGSINIDANNINITGGGQILTTSTGGAPAGDVILKNANTKLSISGNDPSYEQRQAALAAAFSNGYAGGSTDKNTQEVVAFTIDPISQYSGIFANNGLGSTGKGGTIVLNPFSVKIADGGQISVNNQGTGEGGNIFLVSNLVTLNNGKITADSANTTGGNINLTTNDYLLLRNSGGISTNSGSSGKNGNGGNITISSPSLIALPGNNDITANAYNGAGGQVNITSQGLFGINYRAQGSPSTNDITASSTFGQSGSVNITTPGTDPGRDTTELPNVTTDASNQISQVCGASTSQNKLTVAGRGGLPPNANDLLTSDVVWQDARTASSQPVVSSVKTPAPLAPPAVGWVFDGKGKVTLVAAGTQGEPTGTSVVCPK